MDGYPKLASLIGQKPEAAIFRRFSALNTENLLYLQAELTLLEQELKDIVTEDISSGMRRRKRHSKSFYALKESSEHGNKTQWDKRKEIKEKLKEYNEAILQVTQLYTLKEPDPSALAWLRDWLLDEKGGNKFLEGPEASIWTEQHENDLFTLASKQGEGDHFTRWIEGSVLDFLHRHFFYKLMSKYKLRVFDPETGTVDYDDKTFLRITDGISTIVASLLPVLSIIILYFIQSTPARLGAITGFEFMFALVLTFFTKAKRYEVFAANAAFAAVQVVFINTAPGP